MLYYSMNDKFIHMDNVDLKYFLENPKGRCLPRYLQKNHPAFYETIRSIPGRSTTEQIYRYFHPEVSGKCEVCGKLARFKGLAIGYSRVCSVQCNALDPKRQQKINKSKMERYGDPSYNNREKFIKTVEGIDMGFGSEKFKQTIKERYGTDNVSKLDDIKDKKRRTYESNFPDRQSRSTIIQKTKLTKTKRYGDPNFNNRPKAKRTMILNYGVDNMFRLKEIWEASHNQRIDNNAYQKIAETRRLRTIAEHPDIISNQNGMYTCKCPHPDCDRCDEKSFTINIGNYHGRKNNNAEMCTKLQPIGSGYKNTGVELFIKNILDDHNIKYIQSERSILSGKELDFYLPDYKIAIECNGVYWHSSEYKSDKYHLNKFNECAKMGIQLITIWEDQIKNYPDKIVHIILSKLKIYNRRIYARKCKIVPITKHESDKILTNHLQGAGQASVRYGLYYNDELVSVMTFAKKRAFIKSRDNEEWELIRYCCAPGVQVIGGAGKLLKQFIHDLNPESIISYSSNDISTGALYQKLGFTKMNQSVSYWYIEPNTFKRYHRFVFRKSELVRMGYDKKLTESQITNLMKLLRIYDSGQTKWELLL